MSRGDEGLSQQQKRLIVEHIQRTNKTPLSRIWYCKHQNWSISCLGFQFLESRTFLNARKKWSSDVAPISQEIEPVAASLAKRDSAGITCEIVAYFSNAARTLATGRAVICAAARGQGLNLAGNKFQFLPIPGPCITPGRYNGDSGHGLRGTRPR